MTLLRLVLVCLAVLAGIAGGAALLQKTVRPEASADPVIATASTRKGDLYPSAYEIAGARRAVEEKLKAAPEYQAFFDRLKSAFPSEYGSFLVASFRRLATAGDIGGADFLVAEAVRSLRLSRGILAAKAGNPALERIFELQSAILRALEASDPHLCVDFLNGTESAGFFEFSAQNRALVAALAIAGADAIQDGERNKVERAAPAGEDFDALEAALRQRGLGTPEIDALLDGKVSNPPIADATMCRAGQIYLEALAALPEPARLRIYGFAVELMARS